MGRRADRDPEKFLKTLALRVILELLHPDQPTSKPLQAIQLGANSSVVLATLNEAREFYAIAVSESDFLAALDRSGSLLCSSLFVGNQTFCFPPSPSGWMQSTVIWEHMCAPIRPNSSVTMSRSCTILHGTALVTCCLFTRLPTRPETSFLTLLPFAVLSGAHQLKYPTTSLKRY